MDPQIEELKELVRRNIALSEDTNRIVHSMRNSARWNTMFKVIWWLAILGIAAVVYSYFAPYIVNILELYRTVGSGDFLQNFTQ